MAACASGEAQIVVGTHALFQETVVLARLGLAIVDEQHRFGVMQRFQLVQKGIAPDVHVEAADNFDPNDPKTDIQLAKGVDVLKVKMGLLPQSVLDKLQAAAKAKKDWLIAARDMRPKGARSSDDDEADDDE